jgi:hypothetical protein
MFGAVRDGARDPAIEGVEVVTRPALTVGAADVLAAVRLVGRPVSAVHGLYDMRGRARRLASVAPAQLVLNAGCRAHRGGRAHCLRRHPRHARHARHARHQRSRLAAGGPRRHARSRG